MKKIVYISLLSAFSLGMITSCTKEKLDPVSVFSDRDIEQNDFDKYIDREYTQEYNIGVIYKYVDIESNMDYNLSPAKYESSVRLGKLIKYLAIEPYDKVTGSKEFIKNYFPKALSFIGSPAYRNNGTMIIGTAEGGQKITMFNVNALNETTGVDKDFLNYFFFHTIHHEFGHILHQTKAYSTSFDEISDKDYVFDSWNTEFTGVANAVEKGFISPYAGSEPNDDFVEILSFYITSTEDEWEDRVNSGVISIEDELKDRRDKLKKLRDELKELQDDEDDYEEEEFEEKVAEFEEEIEKLEGQIADYLSRLEGAIAGRDRLLEKIDIVKSYLDNSWDIDIDELRTEILNRLDALDDFDQTSLN